MRDPLGDVPWRSAGLALDADGHPAIACFRPQAVGGLWFEALSETFEPRE